MDWFSDFIEAERDLAEMEKDLAGPYSALVTEAGERVRGNGATPPIWKEESPQ